MPLSDTTQDSPIPAGHGAAPESQPSLVLALSDDHRPPEVLPLVEPSLVLGRGTLTFNGGPLLDKQLSREHIRIHRERDRWFVTDLGSRNGTSLDDQPLEGTAQLTPGSVLRIGATLLVFAPCTPTLDEGELAGVSAAMGELRETIRKVAPRPISVLITGETGAGKEMVAQAIHQKSGRPGRLVALNCGAVVESILAAELFGHAKGAFTGASEARDGLFRAADGGTLFLDELGEMPPSLQVQLLRALETRLVRPIGGSRDIPVDVRVIAATNRDLASGLQGGAFRPDLYARLAQWQIKLPPLRQRRADIPFLARRLLERIGAAGRPIHVDLMQQLLMHSWPFNVRGLLNVLTTADIACPPGTPLTLQSDVRLALSSGRPEAAAPAPPASAMPSRAQLEGILTRNKGKVSESARQMGCTRQRFYEWLDAHGLKAADFRK